MDLVVTPSTHLKQAFGSNFARHSKAELLLRETFCRLVLTCLMALVAATRVTRALAAKLSMERPQLLAYSLCVQITLALVS